MAPVWARALVTIVIAACGPSPVSSSAQPTLPPSPPATLPTSTPLATPVSTPTLPPEPTPAPTYATTGLVIHMTNFGDTGSYGPGTTILEDGRIIWPDDRATAIESRLASDGLARVWRRVETTDALDRSANYFPERRPGPEPPGHGAGGYQFDLHRDARSIVVISSDPRSFAGEEAYWVIPPEMDVLARLGDRLNDPVGWLGSDSFAGPARPYQGDRFLVEVHLYGAGGFGAEPDVDAVDWPFAETIEDAGVAFDSGVEGLESRCLIIDSAMASRTVAAELAKGVSRDIGVWDSSLDYAWSRVGGSVTVEIAGVLPYESDDCVELATTMR
jgi:hypothetical protein